MNLTMFPAPSPRFSGRIETVAGFNQGQLSYKEATQVLDRINNTFFRTTPEKCEIEANFGTEKETIVFNVHKDLDAEATLAYYLAQKGVTFVRSNN